jgi:hypothetical protein
MIVICSSVIYDNSLVLELIVAADSLARRWSLRGALLSPWVVAVKSMR